MFKLNQAVTVTIYEDGEGPYGDGVWFEMRCVDIDINNGDKKLGAYVEFTFDGGDSGWVSVRVPPERAGLEHMILEEK